ncbi:MAG TPA: trehalose-phosphatase [Beijerinckiaceae bacterium]|jgi:trehalose 6-phosphate phosphatase
MSAAPPAPSVPASHLVEGAGWALFVDFDGTLVDIVARPEDVAVDPKLKETLVRLHAQLDGALAIVTGRAVAVVDDFLEPVRLDVAGLHGVERRVGPRVAIPRTDERIAALAVTLADEYAVIPGIVVENKGRTVALHWRLAPDRAEEAMARMRAAVATLGDGYRLQWGKAVAEILPAGVSKGVAIEEIMALPPYAGRRPIFVGDDLTDEHGFEAVNRLGGVSIRVGEGSTVAKRRLPDPSAFRFLLSTWAEAGAIALEETADA